VVVGARPTEKEKTLWIIEATKSRILEHTPELMTWEASDKGSSRVHTARVSCVCAVRVVSCASDSVGVCVRTRRFLDEAVAEDSRLA
jgi:hypothetical protein